MAIKTVKNGATDEDIQKSLKVIDDYNDNRIEHDQMIDMIQELYEKPFLISSPEKGAQKIDGLLLFQALWRTTSWMKPLDFMLQGTGASPELEKLQRDGLNTVLDRGGYINCLRGKMGSFFNLLLYGDDLIMVGTPDDDNPFPIEFSNTTLKNVYVNNSALGVRVQQKGRSARKLVLVFSYTKGEFDQQWPEFKDKVEYSMIQRSQNNKDQLSTDIQETKKEDEIEVAYSWDLDTKCFLIYAGGSSTILLKKKGEGKKGYPFVMEDMNKRKKYYIPVLQYSCIPSSEGFWNRGLGHLLYKLTIITRKMINMGVAHVFDNILPIELISVAQGKSASFFNAWKKAEASRAKGKRGIVPMEREAGNPNGNAVSSQSLLTQSLFNEWQAIYNQLIQEVRRLGINIDEIEAGGNKTATEIIALEESSKAFIKQIGEWNGAESQMAVEITINHIKEFVKNSDKTPLDLSTKIRLPSGEQKRMDEINLGMIAEEFKKRRWFARMDLRSGAILSNAMKFTRLNAAIPFFQGTPQFKRIAREAAEFFELDLPEDQSQPQEAPEGAGGAEAVDQKLPAASTDRQEINPNVAVRGPAI